MIVSASRRTDIPAFYSEWFMNRIRAGTCLVPNPFNRNQISRVSLKPEDVDVLVFWTRNPRPLLPHLPELDDRGYRTYFLYTLLANPREIDPGSPPAAASIETFQTLSDRIGPQRVAWRYDPIFLSSLTPPDFHVEAYRHIAAQLKGSTTRSIVSFTHLYRKIGKRLDALAARGVHLLPYEEDVLSSLMRALGEISSESHMKIQSCADTLDLQRFGIPPGKCIDGELLSHLFGRELAAGKDPYQRTPCGCAASKDIGMYDSCLFGCVYCYATGSFERAKANHRAHDPASPSLITAPH